MTITPTVAPPEAQPQSMLFDGPIAPETEALARPFRLGLVGLGTAIGLFARLAAANGFGDLTSTTLTTALAVTSFIVGLGLVLMAAERDRFGAPLIWITALTSAAWGALNWLSPPFDESVTVWSNPDQAVLAGLGVGNGLLLAGIVALAFVRRGPTLTVAATLLAGLATLVSATLLLREEWPSIVTLGVAFALVLLAWDRSPRQEQKFVRPTEPPRISRAALSFISVALCGTGLQLWVSRGDIPRSLPAVALCALLIVGAFASMIRVRREIERRETTLSEWASWTREIRTNEFRSEIETFDSATAPVTFDPRPPVGIDGEAPRKLSFPNLVVPGAEEPDDGADSTPATDDELASAPEPDLAPVPDIQLPTADPDLAPVPDIQLPTADPDLAPVPDIALPTADTPASISAALPRVDTAPDTPDRAVQPEGEPTPPEEPLTPATPAPAPIPAAAASGAFSAMLGQVEEAPDQAVEVADLAALELWLQSPAASARSHPLLVAIEAMSLDEFESLPPEDAAMARQEIGSYLADTMPGADLVAYLDGPYFIVAHASKPVRELNALNKAVQATLRATYGIHAFLRPGTEATISDIVDEAVMAILTARQHESGTRR